MELLSSLVAISAFATYTDVFLRGIKMSARIGLASLLVLLTCPVSAGANPVPSAVPIAVNECSASLGRDETVQHGLNPSGGFETTYTNGSPGKLSYAFTNTSRQNVSAVAFVLYQGDEAIQRFGKSGKFSPHIEIKANTGLSPRVSPIKMNSLRCVVRRVTFEDGSEWINSSRHD